MTKKEEFKKKLDYQCQLQQEALGGKIDETFVEAVMADFETVVGEPSGNNGREEEEKEFNELLCSLDLILKADRETMKLFFKKALNTEKENAYREGVEYGAGDDSFSLSSNKF